MAEPRTSQLVPRMWYYSQTRGTRRQKTGDSATCYSTPRIHARTHSYSLSHEGATQDSKRAGCSTTAARQLKRRVAWWCVPGPALSCPLCGGPSDDLKVDTTAV